MRKQVFIGGLALVALLLVGAGCGGAKTLSRLTGKRAPDAPANPAVDVMPDAGGGQLLGGDRDEHGCIGSAGYSWCPAKDKCLRPWEEECFASAEEGIRYALATKYGKPLAETFVSVAEEKDGFAKGSISFGTDVGEKGGFLAAKLGAQWVIVYDGNGSIDCAKIRQEYEFPQIVLEGFCDPQ